MPGQVFNPGIAVEATGRPPAFFYGEGVFGPQAEFRRLDDIRPSLLDPHCRGPEIVYSIAMDVGKAEHRRLLLERRLLFGVVAYAEGKLGDEPVRSQGHIHRVSAYSGWSTPEVYEIWRGRAVIYMQESATERPGRCYAVYAGPGDVVVVPPGWVHATICADPGESLVFGAWCDREYGFEYDEIRRRRGIAWYPVFEGNELKWIRNRHYGLSELIKKCPGKYPGLSIAGDKPIYTVFEDSPDAFLYVSEPGRKKEFWKHFEP